jgi:hypothetical protein
LLKGQALADQASVFFAGFSYLGESSYIDKNYPYTSLINSIADNGYYLDQLLREEMTEVKPDFFTLNLSSLANSKNESHYVLTLSISSETTSIEKIDNKYKLWIQVLAQVFIFDYSGMKIVANKPVNVAYSELFSAMPGKEKVLNIYKNRIYNSKSGGLFASYKTILQTLNPVGKTGNTIQVLNVTVAEDAALVIPLELGVELVRQRIGESFTQFLSTNQSVNMLPYVKGHAIGNKLAGRYSDGMMFMLELPEPDFAFDISVSHWLKQLYSESTAGSSWIYVSRANFKFYEPLSEHIFFEEFLFNGATKVVPISQSILDEWPAYQETMNVLFDKFTKQISNPTREWLKIHARSTEKLKEFNELKKVIETCK